MAKKIKYGCYGEFFKDEEGNLKYKIAKNDTLWTISQYYYKDTLKYKDIYNLNKDKIKDQHLIYPGQVLTIEKAKPQPKPQQKPEIKPKEEKDPVYDSIDIPYYNLTVNNNISEPVFTGEYVQEEPIINFNIYEYVFGINNMSIKSSEFYDTAILVTKDIIKNKNIRYIEIESIEENAVLDSKYDNPFCTSIEYYISYNNKWIPIFPKNKKRVDNELIVFNNINNNSASGELMFYPDISKPIYVYENGKKIYDSRYIITGKTISIKDVSTKNDYTISYMPDVKYSPSKIIINKEDIEKTLSLREEIFYGTDENKRIVLSDYPYLPTKLKNTNFDPNNKNEEYNICMPVEITLKNKNILDKDKIFYPYIYQYGNASTKTKNITNYNEDIIPDIKNFNQFEYPFIEFYQNGREIYLCDTFKDSEYIQNIENTNSVGDADIIVKYYVPNISVKLKIIMRITNKYINNMATPKINNIKVYGWCIK